MLPCFWVFFFFLFFFPPIFYQIWKSQRETVQGDHPRYSCFIVKTKQTKRPTNLPILVIFVYKLGWAPIKGNLPHFGQSSAHLYSVSHTHTHAIRSSFRVSQLVYYPHQNDFCQPVILKVPSIYF